MVEEGNHPDPVILPERAKGVQEGARRRVTVREVVQPTTEHKLLHRAPDAGWLGVTNLQLKVQDVRLLDVELLGKDVQEEWVLLQNAFVACLTASLCLLALAIAIPD